MRDRGEHNEYEKKRRNAQKSMLDELNSILPAQAGNKPSISGTIARARDYILELRKRIMRLESQLGIYKGGDSMTRSPSPNISQATIPISPDPSFLSPSPMGEVTTTTITQQLQGSSSSSSSRLFNERNFNGEYDDKSPPHTTPIRKRNSIKSQVSPSALSLERFSLNNPTLFSGSRNRRKSSVIMPTPFSNTIFLARRDSFSGFITNLVDNNNNNETNSALSLVNESKPSSPQEIAIIKCNLCGDGSKSTIMLDCDSCGRWYHIECVNITISEMPFKWRCPNCPIPSSKKQKK